MATSSFDKRFVLTSEEEISRFYDTFSNSTATKPINITPITPESKRRAEETLKRLFSR